MFTIKRMWLDEKKIKIFREVTQEVGITKFTKWK